MDLSATTLTSQRLLLRPFSSEDAQESYAAQTSTLTRYLGWDPAPSLDAFAQIWQLWRPKMVAGTDIFLSIRLKATGEFLGMAGLHGIEASEPAIGIWIKEVQHGNGFGREAVATVLAFAERDLAKAGVLYPVVEENTASRHLAECLGGKIVGRRMLRKTSGAELAEVIYHITSRDA
jgi:RimJ/RimL family protein N-acetyltransferase